MEHYDSAYFLSILDEFHANDELVEVPVENEGPK